MSRELSRAQAWAIIGRVLAFTLIAAVSLASMLWLGRADLRMQIALDEFSAKVALPPELPVAVAIPEPPTVRLQTTFETDLPIDVRVPLRLSDTLHLRVQLDGTIPIKTSVHYTGVIPVNTRVTTRILGIPTTLPIRGDIPVSLDIPIDQPVSVNLDELVTAEIDQVIEVPLQFNLPLRVPVNQLVSIPFEAPLAAQITTRSAGIDARLTDATLTLPLRAVSLEQRSHHGQEAEPSTRH